MAYSVRASDNILFSYDIYLSSELPHSIQLPIFLLLLSIHNDEWKFLWIFQKNNIR